MKEKYRSWLNLTGQVDTSAPTKVEPAIKLLRLAGIADLESKLLLSPPVRGVLRPEVEDMVDHISRATFGIVWNDTLFNVPAGFRNMIEGSAEWWKVEDAYREHEEPYETSEATDDEAVEVLLKLGLDFRGDNGQPLRCTKLLCRQAEAAARGLKGHLPDRGVADLTAWESQIARDAQRFMSRKK